MLVSFIVDFHQQLHSCHAQGHVRAQAIVSDAEDIAALIADATDSPVSETTSSAYFWMYAKVRENGDLTAIPSQIVRTGSGRLPGLRLTLSQRMIGVWSATARTPDKAACVSDRVTSSFTFAMYSAIIRL